MSSDLTAERFAQFHLIECVLLAAVYAGLPDADNAAREFSALQREIEAPSKRHWADEVIATENAQHAEVAT